MSEDVSVKSISNQSPMSNGFEKTNLGWQLQQLQQRIGEWVELQLSQARPNLPNLPNVSTPEWLNQLLWLLVRVGFWLIVGWILIQLSLRLLPMLQLRWRREKIVTMPRGELKVEDWLLRSRQFYRTGDYRNAARALYMAMLQQLNDTGIAPHAPSRTDGEYGQIIQQLPGESSYQILLKTHEKVCFSNVEISSEAFERCQQAYEDIDIKSSQR